MLHRDAGKEGAEAACENRAIGCMTFGIDPCSHLVRSAGRRNPLAGFEELCKGLRGTIVRTHRAELYVAGATASLAAFADVAGCNRVHVRATSEQDGVTNFLPRD